MYFVHVVYWYTMFLHDFCWPYRYSALACICCTRRLVLHSTGCAYYSYILNVSATSERNVNLID